MAIRNLALFHQASVVVDLQVITNLAADHLHVQKLVPGHCLHRLAAMAVNTRADQDIHTLGHDLDLDLIPEIVDVAIAAILVDLAQGAVDM